MGQNANWRCINAFFAAVMVVSAPVLGAAPRGAGATEAAARENVRRVAQTLKAPYEDFNGEAFLIVPG
jgi:hypothetical protein